MVSLAVKFSELKFDITYRTSEMTAAQLIIVGLVVVGISWAWSSFSRARKEEEEQKRREREGWRSSTPVRGYSYGSTANNHDHQKRQYRTQDEADRIIARMRSQGKDSMGTLRSYYNPDYGKWFVGNGY